MKIIAVLMFCCIAIPVFSEDFLNVEVVRIYDGDTFFIDITDIPAVFGDDLGVRVRGVDTPEIRGKCDTEKQLAYQARDFVINLIASATVVNLIDVQRGKYFRIIASVMVDGISLEHLLIAEGLAVSYDGGKRSSWCG